jgi:hypothetical protein
MALTFRGIDSEPRLSRSQTLEVDALELDSCSCISTVVLEQSSGPEHLAAVQSVVQSDIRVFFVDKGESISGREIFFFSAI